MVEDPTVKALWDKLVEISQTYDKSQFTEGLEACKQLKKQVDEAKKSGSDTKALEKELRGLDSQHKMNLFDAGQKKRDA